MHLLCDNITYRYPAADRAVLCDLTLHVHEPGFFGLFGPSGVGKTSLAKIISGDISGYDGTVSTPEAGTCLYTHNLERLPGWSSVGKHIDKFTRPDRRALKEALVAAFALTDLMESPFSRLSLGQQNRVNLLRYLLQDFQVLIMDESLANVDEPTREEILLTVKEMFSERCFLYISHNVVEVAEFCTQIYVLRGAGKSPQVLRVRGQDRRRARPADSSAMQHTMLEIVNAA